MAPMEDRLRTMLRDRVDDVTTQPALYRRVKERADRYRRRRLLRLVPAGAAAFGLAIAVPFVLQSSPDVPRIDDLADQLVTHAGPNVPDELVIVRDGEVERLDLATGDVQDVGSPVGGADAVLATPGVVSDDLVIGVLDGPPTDLALVRGGGGLVHHGLDVDRSGGLALSPDGRWNVLVHDDDDDRQLIALPIDDGGDTAGTEGVLARYLPEGAVIQDWTKGAQPTTSAIVYRTPQGALRTLEVEDSSGGVLGLPARNQTDLAALLPTTALAVASSHLAPDDVLGGPVYSLVPVTDGVQLRVTEAGSTTAERDVTGLLGGADEEAVWVDAWGDAAVFGDGERTWIAMRDGNGALLAPRALPDGVTRAAPIAQEIVTPEVAAVPGDPDHALLVLDDGTLVADDLPTGERTVLHPPVNRNMAVHSFTVSVGSTIDDFVAVGYDDGASVGLITYVRSDGGEVVASLTPSQDIPGWANNRAPYAVAPDGRWVAYLGRSGGEAVTHLVPVDPLTAELAVAEARTLDGASAFVQDWTGAVTEVGDRSRLVGKVGEDVFVEHTLERTADGFVVSATTELAPAPHAAGDDGMQLSVAFASQRPGGGDDPRFELIRRWDGEGGVDAALLRYVVGDQVLAERKVPFGGRVGNLSLSARGGTALIVGDRVSGPDEPDSGGRAYVARVAGNADGGVDILLPTVLDDGPVVGALLGGLRADGTGTPADAPADAAADDLVDGVLGAGLVVADDTTVTLVRPEGATQELVTFPAEGERTVVAVAVRPGSTADDLTVAITTRAADQFDVRWLRVVEGEVDTTIDPSGTDFPAPRIQGAARTMPHSVPDLQDGATPAAVWAPDGDQLAVAFRPGEGSPAEVHTIGWTDDGPSDDYLLAGRFELEADRPLTLRGWAWTDDGAGADGLEREGMLLLVDALSREAFTLLRERLSDGLLVAPDPNPLVPIEGEGVLDVADRDGDGTVDVVLRTAASGTSLELRDGTSVDVVGIDAAGPRDVSFVTASEQVVLVVLDPAQPVLVDRATGEVRPAPIDGEVVSADLIR